MFRLAHLSDIHLGPLPELSFRELASKRVTGWYNWQRNRRRMMFGDSSRGPNRAIPSAKIETRSGFSSSGTPARSATS